MTDNNDQLTQCDDVKQLSGGERSFTTLCLLLSLGHVIDTPFRILDEYDVFMDENVRKITLNSIKEHALLPEQREKQFVIVTPNSLKGVITNNEVKIHVMARPDRQVATGLNQQTISFGASASSSSS
jgi:structural maintenance of chromosomes protein 6